MHFNPRMALLAVLNVIGSHKASVKRQVSPTLQVRAASLPDTGLGASDNQSVISKSGYAAGAIGRLRRLAAALGSADANMPEQPPDRYRRLTDEGG
jgi:hypothetical protein